jgi:uncharacterized protein (TIGR02246 family)
MTRRSSIPLMILGLGAVAAPAFAQGGATPQTDGKQVADSIESKWMTNYNSGNSAGVASLFAPDGTIATQAGTVLNGPQAIQDALAARIKAGWPKITTTVLQANAVGDAAWFLGEYAYTGTGPNSGKQLRGHFAKVLTRNGADWRIRLLIANTTPQTG